MASSNTTLLFRNRSPLKEANWLRGSLEHAHCAKRNTSGRASLSAILARALLAALEGNVTQIERWQDGATGLVRVIAQSKSTGKLTPALLRLGGAGQPAAASIPHGKQGQVITYYLGLLYLGLALTTPGADDLLQAYAALLARRERGFNLEECRPQLLLLADELYFWVKYGAHSADAAHEQFDDVHIESVEEIPSAPASIQVTVDAQALTDLQALQKAHSDIAGGVTAPPETEATPEIAPDGGFVGPQAAQLRDAVEAGENVLLAGPTGTGKTLAFYDLVAHNPYHEVVTVEGAEGLLDLDFMGAIVPDGQERRWVDGPVTRAMRLAQDLPTLLFVDEITRVPTHQLNFLIGLLNPRPGELVRRAGVAVEGNGPFHLATIPVTQEIVWCPVANLRILAAGNFGKDYAVHDLDRALRRRFTTVVEFAYLPTAQEVRLVERETGLNGSVGQALATVASETRRLQAEGQLPGCVDTASLLAWARKCARAKARTVESVMQQAALTWADLVCGRTHTGQVNQANFDALRDYLSSLGKLPGGGL